MHVRESGVLVKDIKCCKVTGGGTESSLVRHGVFGFSEYSRLRELNSAWFTSLCFLCSRADWH